MPSLTVEGSLTPAHGVLARGERATWQDTPRIRGLIDKGFLVLVSVNYTDEDLQEGETAELVGDGSGEQLPDAPDQSYGPGSTPLTPASDDVAEWIEFISDNIPGITIPDPVTTEQLRAAWGAYQQQVHGGS